MTRYLDPNNFSFQGERHITPGAGTNNHLCTFRRKIPKQGIPFFADLRQSGKCPAVNSRFDIAIDATENCRQNLPCFFCF